MTEDELNVIEARCNAAAPGPWIYWNERFIDAGAKHPDGDRLLSEGPYDDNYHNFSVADCEFISAARMDVPALVAEVRRLRKIERLALAVAKAKSHWDVEGAISELSEHVETEQDQQKNERWRAASKLAGELD